MRDGSAMRFQIIRMTKRLENRKKQNFWDNLKKVQLLLSGKLFCRTGFCFRRPAGSNQRTVGKRNFGKFLELETGGRNAERVAGYDGKNAVQPSGVF